MGKHLKCWFNVFSSKILLLLVLLKFVPMVSSSDGQTRAIRVSKTPGSFGLMFPDHYLVETTVRNKFECAAFCRTNDACLSYDVSSPDSLSGTVRCILRDMLVLDPKWLVPSHGYANYHKTVPSTLTFLGCFSDNPTDRVMDELVSRVPLQQYTEENEDYAYAAQLCAVIVQNKGYDLLGIEYYGECFGGYLATTNYDKHGEVEAASLCYLAGSFYIGKQNTLAVYLIQA